MCRSWCGPPLSGPPKLLLMRWSLDNRLGDLQRGSGYASNKKGAHSWSHLNEPRHNHMRFLWSAIKIHEKNVPHQIPIRLTAPNYLPPKIRHATHIINENRFRLWAIPASSTRNATFKCIHATIVVSCWRSRKARAWSVHYFISCIMDETTGPRDQTIFMVPRPKWHVLSICGLR